MYTFVPAKKDRNNITLGIDPGASTSPTSIAIIETDVDGLNAIVDVVSVPMVNWEIWFQRKLIADVLQSIIVAFTPKLIVLEQGFYQGKANVVHNKLLGVIETAILDSSKVVHIAPLSVKKFFGSGKLEKHEVAQNLLNCFDIKGKNFVKKLIEAQKFDETDAIAIALAGRGNYG